MADSLPVYRNGKEQILLQVYCRPDDLTISRIENIAGVIRSSGFNLSIGYCHDGAQIYFDNTEQGQQLARRVHETYKACGHSAEFISSSKPHFLTDAERDALRKCE